MHRLSAYRFPLPNPLRANLRSASGRDGFGSSWAAIQASSAASSSGCRRVMIGVPGAGGRFRAVVLVVSRVELAMGSWYHEQVGPPRCSEHQGGPNHTTERTCHHGYQRLYQHCRCASIDAGRLSALARRLRNRAESVLLQEQPEQQRDLRAAAQVIDQLLQLHAEIRATTADPASTTGDAGTGGGR